MTLTPLPSFTLTGNLRDILPGDLAGEIPTAVWASARIELTHNIYAGALLWEDVIYNRPPVVHVIPDVNGDISPSGDEVLLLANDPGLNVSGVQWTATIKDGSGHEVTATTFNAPADGATLDLATVTPELGVVISDGRGVNVMSVVVTSGYEIRPAAVVVLWIDTRTTGVFRPHNMGTSDLWFAIAGTVDTEPPTVPTGLVSSPVTGGFTLTWDASTDNVAVTGYQVRLGTGAPIDVPSGLTHTFTVGSGGGTFDAQVRAGDAAGNWSAWSTALSVTVVAAVPAPIAHYDFHEGSGSTAADILGGLPNLTATTPASAWSGTKATGEFHWTTNVPFTAGTAWTIAVVANLVDPGTGSGYHYIYADLGDTVFAFMDNGPKSFVFYSTPTGIINGPTNSVTFGATHTFVVTCDGTTASIYVDGVLDGSASGAVVPNTGGAVIAGSGNWTSGSTIDDIQIWDVALNATQVGLL